MRGEEFKKRALVEGRRYAKDRMVFLREFCQNARDASATEITITTALEGGQFVLRFQDNGLGMSIEHAKDYLFRLYASSKEYQATSAGCFGVGFWSVLLYGPESIEVDSLTETSQGWRVVMDGDLAETRSMESELTEPGTRITVRRAVGENESVETLASEARNALTRYCRYLRQNNSKRSPLPIWFNAHKITERFAFDGPCWLTFEDGPVEGAVGLGETPSVEVYARGLLVWHGTLLDELQYGAEHVKVSRHPKGLAPRYLLNGNDLNVTYDRRALVDDASLARVRSVARWRMRELLSRYLDQVSSRSITERIKDRVVALYEEIGFSSFAKTLVAFVATMLILAPLVLYWVFSNSPGTGREGDGHMSITKIPRDPKRYVPTNVKAANQWTPLNNVTHYFGPSVEPLTGLTKLALLYNSKKELAFRIASLETLDAGRGIRYVPAERAGSMPSFICTHGCITVAVDISAEPGAMVLPIPTGYAVEPESVKINGHPAALTGVTQMGDPAIWLKQTGTGKVTFKTGPSRSLLTESRTNQLTTLPKDVAFPSELRVKLSSIKALPTTVERVKAAKQFVSKRLNYDTSSELSSRYREFLGNNPSRGWLGFALTEGRGDCDVKNTVLVFMLRHLGIPARLAVGPIGQSGQALPGMHAWVEFYAGDWHLVDATLGDQPTGIDQTARLQNLAREAMRTGSKEKGDPLARGQGLNRGNSLSSPLAVDSGGTSVYNKRGLLKTVVAMATIVFVLSFLLGMFVLILVRKPHPLFTSDNGTSKRSVAAKMLENVLAHPEMWMTSGSLMHRPLLPIIGSKNGMSLKDAMKLGDRGSLWLSNGESRLVKRAVKRGGRILDAADDAFETVVRRLPGATDLDEITGLSPVNPKDAPPSIMQAGDLAHRMNRVLKRCRLNGLGIRLTESPRLRQCRDVDLSKLGLPTSKYVILPTHTNAMRHHTALVQSQPHLAVFRAMDTLTKQSSMLEPYRETIMTEAARRAIKGSRQTQTGG